jgi:hypothetical protein
LVIRHWDSVMRKVGQKSLNHGDCFSACRYNPPHG